jgi:DNA-binding NarL/FixJ family response regulator
MTADTAQGAARILRVVVADDAENLRALLVRALERSGHVEVVATAVNGREALEAVRSARPDVLLLDLSMPVLDGMAVLRQLDGAVPVVVLTGYGEDELGPECRALGARGFVEKGMPIATVVAALRDAAS